MDELTTGERCWCVLGESPWCPVHHPELAGATDAEKTAAKAGWDIRANGAVPRHIARRGPVSGTA